MRIFISAVSLQFKEYRARIASDLRARGHEAVQQDDLRQAGGLLIHKLEAAIGGCDCVVLIVGDAFGEDAGQVPDAAEGARRSYSHWEFAFAKGERLHGRQASSKPLLLYIASDLYREKFPIVEADDLRVIQTGFVEALRKSGVEWREFDGLDDLRAAVLRDLPPLKKGPSWRLALPLGAALALGLMGVLHLVRSDNHQGLSPLMEYSPVPDGLSPSGDILEIVPPPPRELIHDRLAFESEGSGEGFEILEDRRVFDMRLWVPVNGDEQRRRTSPLNLHRRVKVRKSAVGNASEVRFRFQTSGLAVDARPLSWPYHIERTQPGVSIPDDLLMTRYEVVVDVQKVTPGAEFIVELEATYWNNVHTPEQWWLGTSGIGVPADLMTVLILFPDSKPFESVELRAYDSEYSKERIPIPESLIEFQGAARKSFYWRLERPKPGLLIDVVWTWPP